MLRHRVAAGLAFLGFAVLACQLPGQPAGGDDPAAKDKQVVDSKANTKPPAATIHFRKELNLPYPSLTTLGSRIDSARRAHDPVALANAAHELHVAETVSGKKASLDSAAVLKESAELAALKRQEKELRAVLQVTNQMNAAQENVALLQDNINLAKQQAEEEKRSYESNLEPTWKPRKLVVNNYTTQYIDVYVNGNLKGQVQPGMQQTWYIEHRWNPTALTAYGNEDGINWGPRYIWGRFDKYTWNIN
jgi:hypothetical protein